ncbi:MAG TPA: septal ring lytic transglycosylase RlpA family protein [Terrimicrobiaceae bacterium]
MAPVRRHFLVLLSLSLGACATKITEPRKKVAIYESRPVRVQTGIASWYRDHRTASGERFNINALAAAHRSLPFGSKVRVVDLTTENSVIVRINDRGPYIKGRIIDLTVGAARTLGIYHRGIARVRVEVLKEIPILEKPNLRSKPAASQRKKVPDRERSSSRAEATRRGP